MVDPKMQSLPVSLLATVSDASVTTYERLFGGSIQIAARDDVTRVETIIKFGDPMSTEAKEAKARSIIVDALRVEIMNDAVRSMDMADLLDEDIQEGVRAAERIGHDDVDALLRLAWDRGLLPQKPDVIS